MQQKTDFLQNLVRQLKLPGIAAGVEGLLQKAQKEETSYLDFALSMLSAEVEYRNEQNLIKRLKSARLPLNNDLNL
jgi:DNA replication protein DnaC